MKYINSFKIFLLPAVLLLLYVNVTAQSRCDHSDEIALMPTITNSINTDTQTGTPGAKPQGTTVGGWSWSVCKHTEGASEISLNGGMVPYYQGYISSPIFSDGCSAVRFSYSSDTGSASTLQVMIKQGESIVWSQNISVTVKDWLEFSMDNLNIEGDYQVFILNTTNGGLATGQWQALVKDICLTNNLADVTPPSAPADLIATPSFSSIRLTWTASTDDTGVEGYNIYLNGDSMDTVTDTEYTLSALIPETQYTVEVEAFDAAGNRSAKASAVVSTLAVSYYASKVFEFLPAPGQFTNQLSTSAAAQNVVGNTSNLVSLGGFGGYIIVGFDQPIVNHPNNPYGIDFSIKGNSFVANLYGVWTEPGAVQVMKDLNGNGLPDDGEWYELAGSDYYMSGTQKNVEMTYYNPHYNVRYTVPWRTNYGETGALLSNQFHSQPYYPDPFDFNCNRDSLTYPGNLIQSSLDMSTPSYIEFYRAPAFGYCDSRGNSADLTNPQNPYFADSKGAAADGFDISWAVDRNGNHVELDQIDFVRIYTAGNANAGWLGEWSTEVLAIGITKPDPTYVPQDYYLNYIGITQLKVLKGKTCRFDGLLFKNGRPQTEGTPVWSSSNPAVGTIDNTGLFTAVSDGETWLRFSQKSDIPTDSIRLLVVELKGVVLEMEGNSALTSDSTSLIVGETICITAQGLDNIGDVMNGSTSNRFAYESYTWTASDPTVGTIDNGLFKGLRPGRTMVYARSVSNPTLSDSILVVVNPIPPVQLVANPVIISYYAPSGTKKATELMTTAVNSTIYLNSVTSKNGRITPSIEKNVLNYTIADGNFGADTLTFNITSFGIDQNIDIAFIYEPDTYDTPKQLLYVDKTGANENLKVWYPETGVTKKLIDAANPAIHDVAVDGAFAFVAAEGYLSRYNITTYEQTHRVEIAGSSADHLAVYNNLLLAAGHNASENYVAVYYKTDLTLVKQIALSGDVTDMAVVGGKLYVLTTSEQTSQMAIIDLTTLTFEREKSLYAYGVGVSNLVVNGSNIYGVRRYTDSEPATVFRFDTGSEAYSSTTVGGIESYFAALPSIVEPATGDSILLVNGNGFTAYNTVTSELKSGILMSQSGLYPTGSVYDTAERRYYVTYSNPTGQNAAGQVFDAQFAGAGTITGVEDSPNTLRFSSALTLNEAPRASTTSPPSTTIYEKATSVTNITINKNLFTDNENDFAIYVRDISRYSDWLNINPNYSTNGGIQLQAKYADAIDNDSIVTVIVEAVDNYGLSLTRELTITIKPRVYTPEVANPIADVEVDKNSDDVRIPLADVFTQTASSGVTFGKTVSDNTNGELVTASIDDDVLTLSFTPDKTGEAIITVLDSAVHATYGVKYAETSFKVTVKSDIPPVVVTGVALDRTTAELTAGQTLQLTATVSPDDADNKNVTWSSSNSNIVSVNDTGLVTAVSAPGTAVIAVTTEDGEFTATCAITTKSGDTDQSFVLNIHSLTLNIGQTTQLSITEPDEYNVVWSSIDDNIALVSSTGKVIGVNEGTTKIIASDAAKNEADTCIVTVLSPVVENPFELNTHLLTIGLSETAQLSLTAPEHFTVSWRSLDENIAIVSSTGRVVGMAAGTTKVIASDAAKNKADTCNVTVLPVTVNYSIRLNHTVLVMNAGDRVTIEATVTPTSDNRVEWYSSNPAVATVTVGGTVIAVAPGNADITATLPDGTTARCNVTVRDVEATADVLDITYQEATLSFPRFAGTTYYLVHLYEMVNNRRQPVLALKVNPEGDIINIVGLRASDNNIRLTLTDLKAETGYEADIDVIRAINGTDEAVSTLTVSFTTTSIPTGIESLGANVKVWYAGNALHLQNLNGYKGSICSIQGQIIAVFNVTSSDEAYKLSLAKGVYIFFTEKEGKRNTLKFTVY